MRVLLHYLGNGYPLWERRLTLLRRFRTYLNHISLFCKITTHDNIEYMQYICCLPFLFPNKPFRRGWPVKDSHGHLSSLNLIIVPVNDWFLGKFFDLNWYHWILPRIADQMGVVLKNMNTTYDTLTKKQAEFMMLDPAKQTCHWPNYIESVSMPLVLHDWRFTQHCNLMVTS